MCPHELNYSKFLLLDTSDILELMLSVAITTMTVEIRLELLKLRVPLSQAWDFAVKNLLSFEDRGGVEDLTLIEALDLEKSFSNPPCERIIDPDMRLTAREASRVAVQAKFSGDLPELPDRDADLIAQHSNVWSLIGKLLQASSSSKFSSRVTEFATSVLQSGQGGTSSSGEHWRQRARNILHTLSSVKSYSDEGIITLCFSDLFLCERDLVGPSVKLLIRSKRFKGIMSAPDMVSDGEKTLPKLLMRLTEDKEFRQTFVWLPLDPESPLNQSGGSGVIPTNKAEYRFVLSIIMKILFGKLRQRGNGIDKRSSFQERQNQIMSYLGTVPVDEMSIIFDTLFGRVVNEQIGSMDKIKLSWRDESQEFTGSDGRSVLNKDFISANYSVKMGVIQLMAYVVSQMKRKVDAFVPLLACYVVSLIAWTPLEEENGKNVHKMCLLRLNELMTAYSHLGANSWNLMLSPISQILRQHLERSSSAQLSTVFKMVTMWARHDSLIDLFSLPVGQTLVPVLFSPRPFSGVVSKNLYECVLILCGEDPDDQSSSARASSYENSRRLKLRAHKRTGGADEDSGSDADVDFEEINDLNTSTSLETSRSLKIVMEHAANILTSISLSANEGKERDLELRLTVTLAKLAGKYGFSLPVEACVKLLELLSEMVKRGACSPKRKNKNLSTMFEAITEISNLLPGEEIPEGILGVVTNCVLTLDDVTGRLAMARSIVAITKKVSSSLGEQAAAEALVQLNSVKGLQPDVDSHVDVLQDILEAEIGSNSAHIMSSTILVKHCLFLLSSEACDSTVRHCAERFVIMSSGFCEDEEKSSNGVKLLPFARLVMVMAQLHRMLGMKNCEGAHKSALKVLTAFVREFATKIEPNDTEYARLLHRDLLPHISVLEELQHIQRHRRARGLAKLVESDISEYSRKCIVIPLALEAVLQPGVAKSSFDSAFADIGIKGIQSCGNPIHVVVSLLKVHLRKFPDREKVVFRACQKIAQYLRGSDLTSLSHAALKIPAVIVPVLKRKIWDSKGCVKGSSDQSDRHKLANSFKDRDVKEGIVKIDAVVALLEFIQLLPSVEQVNEQICQLVRIVIQGLPSRELENRRAARKALRKCARALGHKKLAYLMKEVRMALPRGGYQAGVAVFTCFSILEALQEETAAEWSKAESIAVADEVMNLVSIEDRQWAALQSKAASEGEDQDMQLARQCIEVKRQKGHELLKLASKILNPSVVVTYLLRNVYLKLNSSADDRDESMEALDDEDKIDNIFQDDEQQGSSSDDESNSKKRKRRLSMAKKDKLRSVQLNSCYGKKYFSRIETALTHSIDGMLENKGFQESEKISVCVQCLAHFEDIHSRKFKLDETLHLFSGATIPENLLRVDEEQDEGDTLPLKRAKIDRRQKQKENAFLVQPGASTGHGHWVTEEWKRGNTSASLDKRSKEIGSLDLKAVKARILGSVGLKIFLGSAASASNIVEVKTALAKFVSRAFCSGIAELFQASAKAVQRLIDAFNGKSKALIAKKLISKMEQLHHSGSDLSFITLKQQRKATQAEIASTCSSLLLALISTEDQSDLWLKQDMMDTLAAHVRASLDVSALQVSGLHVLKRILSYKKFKSATLYDCLNSVGQILVTASNPRVCALAGQLYAHFLVEFPHTEKSLMAKLLVLLKQAQTASDALSRCTALNTVFSFVKALPSKTLQDVFGEIIFVSLAVSVSSEEDSNAKEMNLQVLLTIISRFADSVKRNRLVSVVAEWPKSMTKHQFVFSAAEVCSLMFQEGFLNATSAASVIEDVIRQIPFFEESPLVPVQGQIAVVQSVARMLHSQESTTASTPIGKSLQFVLGHILRFESTNVSVILGALKLAGSTRKVFLQDIEEVENSSLIKDQLTGSLEPWPLMMRVLRVLARETSESNLEIPCVAMRTIAHLLPLCSEHEDVLEVERRNSLQSDDPELGLFRSSVQETATNGFDESLTVRASSEAVRLSALLKKIRFEVRGLMAKSRESIIRMSSLLKLTTALTLSVTASAKDDVLEIALEILVRLATINRVAEEVSIEVPNVSSLFELSVLRPIEQIGCVCKMANGAIESLEKHYKSFPAFFTKQLTAVTASINKDRRTRKISLMNLAVSNPARLATLRLQKSKKKTEKRQVAAKEKIKRIKGLIN